MLQDYLARLSQLADDAMNCSAVLNWFEVSFTSLERHRAPCNQRAKKVVSDSPGLGDFAIGLVNAVFNLPDGQVMFLEEFE